MYIEWPVFSARGRNGRRNQLRRSRKTDVHCEGKWCVCDARNDSCARRGHFEMDSRMIWFGKNRKRIGEVRKRRGFPVKNVIWIWENPWRSLKLTTNFNFMTEKLYLFLSTTSNTYIFMLKFTSHSRNSTISVPKTRKNPNSQKIRFKSRGVCFPLFVARYRCRFTPCAFETNYFHPRVFVFFNPIF